MRVCVVLWLTGAGGGSASAGAAGQTEAGRARPATTRPAGGWRPGETTGGQGYMLGQRGSLMLIYTNHTYIVIFK